MVEKAAEFIRCNLCRKLIGREGAISNKFFLETGDRYDINNNALI